MASYYPSKVQPDGSYGTISISTEAIERARNTITFCAGNPNIEMLKVSPEGFWVRGVKVTQDDKEAETVYNAFKAWMAWAQLNKDYR